MGILNKVTDYFKRHPEIDDRLYPYYISQVSNFYFDNTDFRGGDWKNWHGGEFADQDIPEKYKYGIDTKYSVDNLSMKDLTDIVNYHDYKINTMSLSTVFFKFLHKLTTLSFYAYFSLHALLRLRATGQFPNRCCRVD